MLSVFAFDNVRDALPWLVFFVVWAFLMYQLRDTKMRESHTARQITLDERHAELGRRRRRRIKRL